MEKYIYEINYDEFPENPREWDNLGTVCTALKNYSFGDVELSRNEDSLKDAFLAHLADEGLKLKDVLVLPIYAYIHSNITINTGGFSCPWDSGAAGYIYVTRKRARAEYGRAYTARALKCLAGEIETLDQWLNGEVYTYTVCNDAGEVIDECSGFYGREYCENEARGVIEWHEENDKKAAARAELNAGYIAAWE